MFYTPKCMMNQFSRDFMTLFPSRADLVSPACLATLKAIGVVFRLCIARIECRHAAVRRLLLSRGATWAEQLCVASADWLMMRDRIIELATDASHRHLQGASEAQQPARPAQRGSGGGGPCRAFMSEFLRGKSFANRDQLMREGHAEFRRIKAEGGAAWQRLLDLGAAGTAAARASGHAFGRPARRGGPAAVGPASRQPVSRLLGGPAQPQDEDNIGPLVLRDAAKTRAEMGGVLAQIDSGKKSGVPHSGLHVRNSVLWYDEGSSLLLSKKPRRRPLLSPRHQHLERHLVRETNPFSRASAPGVLKVARCSSNEIHILFGRG